MREGSMRRDPSGDGAAAKLEEEDDAGGAKDDDEDADADKGGGAVDGKSSSRQEEREDMVSEREAWASANRVHPDCESKTGRAATRRDAVGPLMSLAEGRRSSSISSRHDAAPLMASTRTRRRSRMDGSDWALTWTLRARDADSNARVYRWSDDTTEER